MQRKKSVEVIFLPAGTKPCIRMARLPHTVAAYPCGTYGFHSRLSQMYSVSGQICERCFAALMRQ